MSRDMTGVEILQQVVQVLVGAIVPMAEAVGAGLSALATSIMLTGEGESQTISVFGNFILVFGGIALAVGLGRLVLNFFMKWGSR